VNLLHCFYLRYIGHFLTSCFSSQALAVTRVSISPKEGGPNDFPSMDAQSEISKNRRFSGSGSDTDIITSSARAYVSALNKLLSWNMRKSQKQLNGDSSSGAVGNAVAAKEMEVEVAP
jgi:2-isopropylmalate synthase